MSALPPIADIDPRGGQRMPHRVSNGASDPTEIMFDRDIYMMTRRGQAEPAMISLFATHHPASRTTRVRG